jgi:FkbH-like protein
MSMTKVALVGDAAVELIAPYFRKEGYDVYVPSGFGAWRQELLDENSALHEFNPDFIYDVTEKETVLAGETDGFFDERMRKLASMPYSLAGIEAIVDEFDFWRQRGERKILAVDADNTLWQGILSEDGAENLVPYTEFQNGLRELAAQGVLVVVLSKNDPPAMPGGPFDLDFVTSSRINWAPKAGNLIELCRELNLSTDSVVFVDDNPHERAQMKAHLPEVAVARFPADMAAPRQFLRRLKEYFFSGSGATDEDLLRTDDYRRKAVREELRKSFASAGEYLEDLQLRVRPGLARSEDLDRLAQMAGKTNQFNATTIRRSRGDFAAMLENPDKRIFTFKASDRFGEQGLVCYAIVDLAAMRITDFVMSCRAMGRTLEYFACNHIEKTIGRLPPVDFTPTAKNAPFKEFLDTLPSRPGTYYKEAPEI